jgi:hypothetical protein
MKEPKCANCIILDSDAFGETIAIEKLMKLLGSQVDIEIQQFEPFDHARVYHIVRRLYFQDGGAENFGLMDQAGEHSYHSLNGL